MRRAKVHHPAAKAADFKVCASVTLPYDDRHRRRIKMTDDDGVPFMLDLEQATYLSDGDLLELEDGTAIAVKAALEDVLDVSCNGVEQTARVAWHIGNRHMPVQVLASGVLRLRYDHVLEDMVAGLGAKHAKRKAPFSPEPGAYTTTRHDHAAGHTEGRSGGHAHAHH